MNNKMLDFPTVLVYDKYEATEKLDNDTICICINKLPYKLTTEDAKVLMKDLNKLLIEEIQNGTTT